VDFNNRIEFCGKNSNALISKPFFIEFNELQIEKSCSINFPVLLLLSCLKIIITDQKNKRIQNNLKNKSMYSLGESRTKLDKVLEVKLWQLLMKK